MRTAHVLGGESAPLSPRQFGVKPKAAAGQLLHLEQGTVFLDSGSLTYKAGRCHLVGLMGKLKLMPCVKTLPESI